MIVKYCCCGCSLKTGTLIYLVTCVIGLAFVHLFELSILSYKSFDVPLIDVFGLMIKFIALFVCSLGIYGAVMEDPEYLLPFLVFHSVVIGSIILGMLLGIPLGMALLDFYQRLIAGAFLFMIILMEFGGLCAVGIGAYIFIVVFSFYDELKAKTKKTTEDGSVPKSG